MLDLWGARYLDDLQVVRMALLDMAAVCDATVLDIKLYYFTPHYGIAGMVLLAQSHISIHSWPEHRYAAIDMFACCFYDVRKLLAVVESAFVPEHVEVVEQQRGIRRGSN